WRFDVQRCDGTGVGGQLALSLLPPGRLRPGRLSAIQAHLSFPTTTRLPIPTHFPIPFPTDRNRAVPARDDPLGTTPRYLRALASPTMRTSLLDFFGLWST